MLFRAYLVFTLLLLLCSQFHHLYNKLFCFLYLFFFSPRYYILFLYFLMCLDDFQIFRKHTSLFKIWGFLLSLKCVCCLMLHFIFKPFIYNATAHHCCLSAVSSIKTGMYVNDHACHYVQLCYVQSGTTGVFDDVCALLSVFSCT